MGARFISIFTLILIFGSLNRLLSSVLSEEVNIDVIHYNIDLQFDWAKKKADGKVILSFVFMKDSKVIQLSSSQLLIKKISEQGQQSIDFLTDTLSNLIYIHFDKVYKSGTRMDLAIQYETNYINEPDPNFPGGSFGKGLRFFYPTKVNPVKRRQIWSQSELLNASYWFPCTSNFADLSTSEFTATVDKGLSFISNGLLIQRFDNKDGSHTFHYKTEKEHPVYLTAFVVGEYLSITQKYKDITLLTYCYADEVEAALATIERLPDMMRFLSVKTGYEFPFSQYAQIVVQDYPFPSLTGQHTLSIISDNMIDDFGTHQDFLYLWDGVEFNALASQWFGNIIIPAKVEDIWLSKAFAQYFERLYTIEKHGKEEYLLWYHPWETGSVFNDWNSGNRHALVPEKVLHAEKFANDSYAKYKGALVLRMLESEIGNDAMLKSISHFIQMNAFKPVTTKEFQKSVLTVTGKDMQWFFDQWIYASGHPFFKIQKSYDYKSKKLILEVHQNQSSDSTIVDLGQNYFQGNVGIEIENKMYFVRIEAKKVNYYYFGLEHNPQFVHFDAGSIWFKEVEFKKTADEYLSGFLYSNDFAHKIEAMNNLALLAKNSATGKKNKSSIIKAFIDEIQSNSYWRFRYNILGHLRTIQSPPYEQEMLAVLQKIIKNENSWVKAGALTNLGMSNDSSFADIYISCLNDESDRVISSAALALGKCRSSKAYAELLQLKNRKSWKNQSLVHLLNGMAALGHDMASSIALEALQDNTSPRWFLGNAWDYPFVAAQTLKTTGRTDEAYLIVKDRIFQALKDDNIDDVFHQVLLLVTLANPNGHEIFPLLKARYNEDINAMNAIQSYEEQFKVAIEKN